MAYYLLSPASEHLLARASGTIFSPPPPITGKQDKVWDLREHRSRSPRRFIPTCVFSGDSQQRLRLRSKLEALKADLGRSKTKPIDRKRKTAAEMVKRDQMSKEQKVHANKKTSDRRKRNKDNPSEHKIAEYRKKAEKYQKMSDKEIQALIAAEETER